MQQRKLYISLLLILFVLIGCDKDVSVSPPDEPPPDGYIFIESIPPGAQIYLEGKNRRRATPDSITWLETGVYNFALKKKYFLDTTFTAEIVEGERKNTVINYLENPKFYGRLECNSRPQECDIYLNDSLTGEKTPHIFNNLIPGLYKVTYKKEGYEDKLFNIGVWSSQQSDTVTTLIDTTKWKYYNTSNSSIPVNSLTCLEPDPDGSIWFGTTSEGLYLRTTTGNYINYSISNTDISNNHITAIAIDNQNYPWISTYAGASTYHERVAWRAYSPKNSPLPYEPLLSIDTRLNGTYALNEAWTVSEKGVYYFYRKRLVGPDDIPYEGWSYFDFDTGFPRGGSPVEITIDGSGDKWIATNGGGVVKIREFVNIETFTMANSGLPTNDVTAIASFGTQVWAACATFSGKRGGTLAYYQDGDWHQFVISIDDEMKAVRDLFIDNKGRVWASTNLGVYLANGFNDIRILNEETTGLDLTNVIEIKQDPNGNIWMATSGNGLIKYMGE